MRRNIFPWKLRKMIKNRESMSLHHIFLCKTRCVYEHHDPGGASALVGSKSHGVQYLCRLKVLAQRNRHARMSTVSCIDQKLEAGFKFAPMYRLTGGRTNKHKNIKLLII